MFNRKTSKNMYRELRMPKTIFTSKVDKNVKYSIWEEVFVFPQSLYTMLLLPWMVKINVK